MTYDHFVGFTPDSRVRELRAARGWSQGDFAAMLNVSQQTLHAIETGRCAPSLPLARQIAEGFAIPIEEVFGR